MGLLRILAALAVSCLLASAASSEAALEPMPPGARSATERAGLSWIRPGKSSRNGSRFVEVIEDPLGGGASRGAGSWIEVEYTVDPVLEAEIRKILAASGIDLGHVILMDPASGEVFAYVSTAPEVFPATRTYPTASLMKVVTAAAVLRKAPQVADQECRYEGSPYRVWRAHLDAPPDGGAVDSFRRAIAISNNQCFARFAVRDLGEEALLEEVRRVGLLEAPAAHHPPGSIEPIEDSLDLANLGSGLAGSFVTPLAAARLAAALAEGALVRPYWIAGVRGARGDPIPLPEREAPRVVWPEPLARELREQMVEVTSAGTARGAFRETDGSPALDSVRVSGKTGTLSGTDPPGLYQWFIGVAPADSPRVAISAVVVSDPDARKSASTVAADVLAAVFCEAEECLASRAAWLQAREPERAAEEAKLQREIAELTRLDRPPRPVGEAKLDLPRKLRREKVDGRVVLLLKLSPEGEVLDARVDASDVSEELDAFVVETVKGWRFSPPTWRGRPIEAVARLPIPIRVD